jgi:hypothetical protein
VNVRASVWASARVSACFYCARVCLCSRECVCAFVRVRVLSYACVFVHKLVCERECVCVFVSVVVHVCPCLHVCLCACEYVYVPVRECARTGAHGVCVNLCL